MNVRHLDNEKRGYRLDVGGLVKLIARTKTQRFAWLTADERNDARAVLLLSPDRTTSDDVGEQLDVLRALGELTPGQTTLLRWRLRR